MEEGYAYYNFKEDLKFIDEHKYEWEFLALYTITRIIVDYYKMRYKIDD